MNEAHVYIETSIRWPRSGDGIVGIIFTNSDDSDSKNIFGKVQNASEHSSLLYGLDKALSYLTKYQVIHVHTSSGYLAGCFSWLDKWEEASWKTSKGEAVKYADIWQSIASKTKGKQLKVHLNEFNGYRNWLIHECDMRGRKHGFIL